MASVGTLKASASKSVLDHAAAVYLAIFWSRALSYTDACWLEPELWDLQLAAVAEVIAAPAPPEDAAILAPMTKYSPAIFVPVTAGSTNSSHLSPVAGLVVVAVSVVKPVTAPKPDRSVLVEGTRRLDVSLKSSVKEP